MEEEPPGGIIRIMLLIALRGIVRASEAVNEAAGRWLSRLLPLMTAMTLTVIVLGSVFRVGWVWMAESVVYMHGALFMLGAAYTLRRDGHVRIDVIYARLTPRRRAWVNLAGSLLLLMPMCGAVLIYSWGYVAESWRVLEHSPEGGGLPAVFLLKTCIPAFALLLALEALSMAASSLLEILEER